jgi:hypothetical protein
MTRNKTRAFLLAAMFVLGAVIAASSSPQAPAQSTPPQSGKIIKTRFVVLNMMYRSLQVRSLTDVREIHTFSYSPAIRAQMQTIHDAGGYQYGDHVVVSYEQGTDVALKIKGKPSKPK